jgi:hypothetical protein
MGIKDEAELNLKRLVEGAKLDLSEKQTMQKLMVDGASKEAALDVQQLIEGAKLVANADRNNEPNNQ